MCVSHLTIEFYTHDTDQFENPTMVATEMITIVIVYY
jgi:hypothetical protein